MSCDPPPLRVGLHLSAPAPTRGGGFTITGEVLTALARAAPSGRHELTTFGWHDPTDYYAPGVPPLPHLPLPMPLRAQRAGLSRVSRSADRLLGIHSGGLWGELNDPLLGRYLARRFDLIWYLEQSVCLTLEVPFITTVWDTGHRRFPFLPELSADGEWERRERTFRAVLPRAAAVVVGTEAGKREVESHYAVHPDRLRILPHPTPAWPLSIPEDPAADLLSARGLRAGGLLYPAQLWPHKNHATLLRALALLQREHGLNLDLICSGSDQGNLAHLQELAGGLGVTDRVRWLGFVERDLLRALYRSALALVYPSLLGPENLPPLEAFSLGCPVAAARVPGAEEQLGDSALLFDPLDAASIAAAVARLAREPDLRERLIGRGRLRAGRFTVDDYAQGARKVLDEIAALRACWGR